VEHLEGVGGSLETAVRRYNDFVGSLERQVMPAARRFEELGAKSAKTMPAELPNIEILVREPKLPAPGEAK